ncbi:MAG: PHB depolymerase family esterase [Pseudomonadota bacterium]|jgi:poly(hydroxyalkanoate) depolymerase family esterase
MRTLSDTITRLAAAQAGMGLPRATGGDRLTDMVVTGANPGQLVARAYVPEGLEPGAPLVVVLHGCTQNADGYDRGSGWSTLADRHGFALLYPEQQRGNNANLCFNWFVPEDIDRNGGEALSIRSMIVQMIAEHDLDPSRVFVTGLSAGGAMTAVMLATWPELFAGGAIVAGLPYGSATTMPQAFDRMRGHGGPAGPDLAKRVSQASGHAGPWPLLSVWHGTADMTVAVSNMDDIVDQWRLLQGIDAEPARNETMGNHGRRIWTDARGEVRIEAHTIAGMGHGTPIAPDEGCGAAMPHMLDVGICSTSHIAAFWGIADPAAVKARTAKPAPRAARPAAARPPLGLAAAPQVEISGVKKVIEDALRAAGLMR